MKMALGDPLHVRAFGLRVRSAAGEGMHGRAWKDLMSAPCGKSSCNPVDAAHGSR